MMLPLELYFRWQILNFATTVSFKLTFTLLFCTFSFFTFYENHYLWVHLQKNLQEVTEYCSKTESSIIENA